MCIVLKAFLLVFFFIYYLMQQVLSVHLLVLQVESDDPSENKCGENIDIPLAGFVVGKSNLLLPERTLSVIYWNISVLFSFTFLNHHLIKLSYLYD